MIRERRVVEKAHLVGNRAKLVLEHATRIGSWNRDAIMRDMALMVFA
jgi:hypothetical protein